MREVVDKIHETSSKRELFKRGLFSGVGWAFGATIGFAIVSTLLVFIVSRIGAIPILGGIIARIVEATLLQLSIRTPVIPQ